MDAHDHRPSLTRAWHADHPGGSRDELLAAWHTYRSLPVDERGW